jgi:hypothetical protein
MVMFELFNFIFRNREEKITHSKVLVKKNMQFWLEISISIVGFKKLSVNNPFNSALVVLRNRHSESGVSRARSDYKVIDLTYSANVYSHLESDSEYKTSVLKHLENMKSSIEDYNKIASPFLDDAVKCIIRGIKVPPFVEFSKGGEEPLKYFIREDLSLDIGDALFYYLQNERVFEVDKYASIEQEGTKWKLFINHVFAKSDDKKELQQILLDIKSFLNDANTIEKLKTLRGIRKKAESELQSFKEQLTEIMKLVENGIPLKGKCSICGKSSKEAAYKLSNEELFP